MPGLHGTHCHDPSALVLLPGAQGWQLLKECVPGEGEKRPAGHGDAVPAALPEAHTDPMGHSVKVRSAATPEYCVSKSEVKAAYRLPPKADTKVLVGTTVRPEKLSRRALVSSLLPLYTENSSFCASV